MDYGLIGGLGAGLSEGLKAYQDAVARREKREADAEARKFQQEQFNAELQMKGYRKDPETGKYTRTDEFKQEDERDYQRKMNLVRAAHPAKGSGLLVEGGLTEAEKAVDKKYAEESAAFTGGGETNAQAAIDRLEAYANQLEAPENQHWTQGGGRFAEFAPDVIRPSGALERKEQIPKAANTTLKELFGGQLSDKERESAAAEYYNDKLDNAANARILRDKIKQLRGVLADKQAKAEYLNKNRTLKGYSSSKRGLLKDKPKYPETLTMPDGKVHTLINPETGEYSK